MKKIISFALFLIFFLTNATAQIDHQTMLDAYFTEDFEVWKRTIDATNDTDTAELKQIVNYEYGYIGLCLGRDRTDEATRYIDKMKTHLQTLEKCGYSTTMLNVYWSALCAFELSMDHWKFATLGIESVQRADKAYKSEPNNPFVLSLKGNTDFYRPSLFGGSKKNAISVYEKAVQQYEAQQLTMHWNYYATLLTLAQAYEKTDNLDRARTICKKLMQVAPNFKYVKETYWPKIKP